MGRIALHARRNAAKLLLLNSVATPPN